jgi:hypothetical protein
MLERLKRSLSKGFTRTWVVILILASAILGARYFFVSQHSPTLEEVLARNAGGGSPDISLYIVSLLALSLATISVAKGYEIVKRSKSVGKVALPEDPAVGPEDSELGSLRRSLEEIRRIKDWLVQENAGLKGRLHNQTSEVEDINRAEQMLRKSNISLSKECERLKSENEILTLKVNSLVMKPKRKIGKKKTKTKALAKKVSRKKRSVRK